MATRIQESDSQAEIFETIRSLIEKVELTPDGGELRINLHGQLAGILEICDLDKEEPAASYEERALQIKMVAGPATTFTEHI